MAEQERRFTRDEVAQKKKGRDTLFVIDNIVYDVTPFLDEHPGGHEVLQNVAGKDATEDFDDVGHSMDAKELMKKYRLGEIVDEEKTAVKKRAVRWDTAQSDSEPSFTSSWKFPVLLAIAATLLYYYLF